MRSGNSGIREAVSPAGTASVDKQLTSSQSLAWKGELTSEHASLDGERGEVLNIAAEHHVISEGCSLVEDDHVINRNAFSLSQLDLQHKHRIFEMLSFDQAFCDPLPMFGGKPALPIISRIFSSCGVVKSFLV